MHLLIGGNGHLFVVYTTKILQLLGILLLFVALVSKIVNFMPLANAQTGKYLVFSMYNG